MDKYGLSKEDRADIENIKYELTDSLESIETPNVLSLVNYFNDQSAAVQVSHRLSLSAPNSPSKGKFHLPVRGSSIPDLSNIAQIELIMSAKLELTPLKGSRAGHKAWISRTIASITKMSNDGTLTLCNLKIRKQLFRKKLITFLN